MKDLIEIRIIEEVRNILKGRVNEIINDWAENLPVIEFGNYQGDKVIIPIITLADCEQTEKDRIIKLDVYNLTIDIFLPEMQEGEYFCYIYNAAIALAFCQNPTLNGIANMVTPVKKKYNPPKINNCGEGWSITLNYQVKVEGMKI